MGLNASGIPPHHHHLTVSWTTLFLVLMKSDRKLMSEAETYFTLIDQ